MTEKLAVQEPRSFAFDKVVMHFSPLDGHPLVQPVLLHTLRGFFFSVIGNIDPSLADKAHAPEGVSSFALQHRVSRKGLTLYCTMFSAGLAAAMREYLKRDNGLIVNFGREKVRLDEISIETVTARSLRHDTVVPPRFRIVFRTPTYFKQPGGKLILLPDLAIASKNLCTLWNELLPEPMHVDPAEVATWIDGHVSLMSFQLGTSMVSLGGEARKLTGFKGWANYKILPGGGDEEVARAFWGLLQLAHHANMGGSRTAGFGQVECIPNYESARPAGAGADLPSRVHGTREVSLP